MISNIQFLRAWAALAVVFFHLRLSITDLTGFTGAFFDFFLQFGYAGVDVFFVISGYVIWISSQSKTDQSENKKPAHFIYNRSSRIYLGYWPYFFIAWMLLLALDPSRLEKIDLIGSALLTKFHLPQLLIQVTWTLIYEMYFYVFFTILLFFPRRFLPKLLLLFAGLITVIQTSAILTNDIYAPENLNYTSLFFAFFTSPLCLQFLAGCGIGIFFERHRLTHLKTAIALALAVFGFTLWYQQTYLMPTNLLSQGYYMPERALLFGVFAVLLVAVAIECEMRGKRWIPKFSQLIGGASYSLYLAHMPLIFVVMHFSLVDLARQADWLWMAPWLLLCCIMGYSVAHYLWIERPLMKQSKRLENWLFK